MKTVVKSSFPARPLICIAAISLGLFLIGCSQPGSGIPPVQYTITFDSHGGPAVESITADEGTEVPKPTLSTREDHIFRGWYSAVDGGTRYLWPHTLTDNVSMHAQWRPIPPGFSPEDQAAADRFDDNPAVRKTLEKNPDEVKSAADVAALLPDLEEALAELCVLSEAVRELLAEDIERLESLQEKVKLFRDPQPAGIAVQFDRNTFNRERALWEAQHITDYIFTEIYFPDYPAGNVRITVSGNEAVQFEPLEDYEDYTLFGETISGIYDKIEEEAAYWEKQFRTGKNSYHAVNFTISYNETYHFPEEIHFGIIEPDLGGGWYNVTIENFVTAEIASQKQENFDITAFNREKRLWEEQNIENYTFTQVHESNYTQSPAAISFTVSASATTPLSGDENDMLKCYGGSISLIYSVILSDFKYWRSELYKNDDYVSINFDISYNEEWHYPESVRFRIGLSSGEMFTGRWMNLDIVEFSP
jgi:hypothetical protein